MKTDATSARTAKAPRALSLELTKGCNLRCGYCYYAAREDAYDARTTMSPEVAEQSVDLLVGEAEPGAAIHLHLFGGEPLLNFKLVRHVVEYGERRARESGHAITFEVTTNGTRFTDEVIGFLNAHRMRVGVSFDGPPDVQDVSRPAMRGSSHAAALPGIRRFLDSRAGTDLEGETHCSVVVTRRELDLVRVVDHLEELGFTSIILTPATDLTGSTHGLSERDLPEIRAAYDALAERHEARVRAGRKATVTFFESMMQRLLSGRRKESFCGAAQDYLGVAADGTVTPCYRFYENGEFEMGDVGSGIDTAVTEKFTQPLENRLACSTCWARYFCGGGCHHDNLIKTGDLGDPNPVTCEVLRHGMDRTLEMWGRLSRDGLLGGRGPAGGEGAATMSKAFGPDDKPKAKDTCHVREVGDERVVYEPASHEVAFLNPTAAWILASCDGARTVAELAGAMEDEFDAPREVLERDLLATLAMLRDKGLLV